MLSPCAYLTKLNSLTVLSEGVDVYSEWIDACENVHSGSNDGHFERGNLDPAGTGAKQHGAPAARSEQYEEDFVDEDGVELE